MNRVTPLVASVALAMIVTGCASQPGQQNPGGLSNTGMGAIIGTLGGAAAGALIGNSGKGALIGAAAGAALGTGVGYYMDRQKAELESKLRSEISSGQMQLQQNADQSLVVTMNEDATFNLNSAVVKPAFYPAMNKVAETLKQYNQTTLVIRGYTDSTGAATYNQQLSLKRANAVKSYLVGQGVATNRIQTIGMGESDPRASNDTAQGRAMNRRVSITIVPQQGAQ